MIEVYLFITISTFTFTVFSTPHPPLFFLHRIGILLLFTVKVASAECFSDCLTLPPKVRKVKNQHDLGDLYSQSLVLGA